MTIGSLRFLLFISLFPFITCIRYLDAPLDLPARRFGHPCLQGCGIGRPGIRLSIYFRFRPGIPALGVCAAEINLLQKRHESSSQLIQLVK